MSGRRGSLGRMRHLAFALLVIGCSSSGKSPAQQPGQPGAGQPGAGTTGTAGTPGTPGTPGMKPEPPPDTGGYRLVAPASLSYAPLGPDASGPQIAVVTGDLKKGGGFFLRLPPGFKSGLHTHTSDYHAIVISGAPRHWLPGEEKKAAQLGAGSYWFQPGGQPHGDECTGTEPCLVYVVVTSAFDFTATPNAKPVKPGSYFLVARKDLKFAPIDPVQPEGAKLAIVSGNPQLGPVAFIIELPPNSNAGLHSHTSEYHALVLEGAPAHWLPHDKTQGEPLATGAYWFQPGGYDHGDRCTSSTPCRMFVMMPKALDFKPPAKK